MRGVHGLKRAVVLSVVSVLCACSTATAGHKVSGATATTTASSGTTATKGPFAFLYTTSLTPAEIDWLKRFDVVVPGDILPTAQVQTLRDAGAKLFFYAWGTGNYIDPTDLDPDSWEAEVWANRLRWLLNPTAPAPSPDGLGRTYYYDPYASDFQKRRITTLNNQRVTSKYHGVFFDLPSSEWVPDAIVAEYDHRHDRPSFDESHALVLRNLKKKGSAVFTNQGYRTAATHLPVTDYDLTESLITSTSGARVQVFIDGRGLEERKETQYATWTNLKIWVDDIQASVNRYNKLAKIFHLNYVSARYRSTGRTQTVNGVSYPVVREEPDRPAIFYGLAAAKLWAHESYSWGDTLDLSKDEVYFAPLGRPVGTGYVVRDGAAIRYYDNGVVVVATSTNPISLDLFSPSIPPGTSGLVDLYGNQTIVGFRTSVEPTVSEVSGERYPAGRVYLYLR